MSEFRTYNVLLTDSTAIYLNLLKYSTPTDFAVAADWTPASGDVKVSLDGAAAANITNLPTYVTNVGWKFILTAAELSCKQLIVRIADSATKAVVDDMFVIETTGDANSMWPDPSSSTPVYANITQIGGSSTAGTNLKTDYDGTGYNKAASTIGHVGSTGIGEIADGVWDEPISGHTTTGTYGETLQFAHVGFVQAGSGSSITLASGASSSNSYYNGRILIVVAGPGKGQIVEITAYVGSTKVATVSPSLGTALSAGTSKYIII